MEHYPGLHPLSYKYLNAFTYSPPSVTGRAGYEILMPNKSIFFIPIMLIRKAEQFISNFKWSYKHKSDGNTYFFMPFDLIAIEEKRHFNEYMNALIKWQYERLERLKGYNHDESISSFLVH